MALPLREEQGLFFCGCASRNTRLEYHKKRHFARVFFKRKTLGHRPQTPKTEDRGAQPHHPGRGLGQSILPSGGRLRRRLILAVLIPLHPDLANASACVCRCKFEAKQKNRLLVGNSQFPFAQAVFLPKHVSPPLRRSENRSCAIGFQGRNSLGGSLRAKPSRSFYSSSYSFSSFRARAASMRAKA